MLGARFDDRVTGRLDAFSPDSQKVHVDIDRSSINKIVRVDLPIIGDVGHALEDMLRSGRRAARPTPTSPTGGADRRLARGREPRLSPSRHRNHAATRDPRLEAADQGRSPIITTEVGQHQMWAAQHFGFEEPNRWLTSGGLGTMGYGLPAAIGAQLGNPDALVIDIAGEASIQMNMQEMATAVQYRLPVKIFILNNECMGMVRQWQELTYASRYSHSYSDSAARFREAGRSLWLEGHPHRRHRPSSTTASPRCSIMMGR